MKILGIGNAIVDVICKVDDQYLINNELIKSTMKLIDEIISYEKKNSPIKYSSAPGTWSDNSVGAVDLHASQKAMDDAFEWQAGNKKWSNMFDQIASACGITTDDFVIEVMKAK